VPGTACGAGTSVEGGALIGRFLIAIVLGAAALGVVPAACAEGDPATAALQVALRREGFYAGPVDGIAGAATAGAVRALQAANGLAVDGVAGPQTDRLLGPFARRELGTRVLGLGEIGWDVAELQFALAWHGFPSGEFDGRFGTHLESALRRFQQFAGLPVDGCAGPATLAALRAPVPRPSIVLAQPIAAPVGDGYGPRGDRFHAGIDLVAAWGEPVTAAAAGRVAWVGYREGWGLLVTIAHGGGVRTLYAHLSSAAVRLGEQVETGELVGRVGATGDATGPHLHFEVRVGGAAVDPLVALP
jgi:murein DD-endopeptidase MepM/ murein hydrolase activator NlpD